MTFTWLKKLIKSSILEKENIKKQTRSILTQITYNLKSFHRTMINLRTREKQALVLYNRRVLNFRFALSPRKTPNKKALILSRKTAYSTILKNELFA
jgi:hypothetical protein